MDYTCILQCEIAFLFNILHVSILSNQSEELELLPYSYLVGYSLVFKTLSNKGVFVIWNLLSSCLWKTDTSRTWELVPFPGELNCTYHTISLKCTVLLASISSDCVLNALQSFPLSIPAIPEVIFQNQQLCKIFCIICRDEDELISIQAFYLSQQGKHCQGKRRVIRYSYIIE